jgi:predicted nucleotidyltransferase
MPTELPPLTSQIEEFRKSLSGCDSHESLIDLCRRTVLHGTPSVFSGRENQFYSFRKTIAEKFSVNFHEVYIVGSAKLGFSPFKNYKPFDQNSDIDVSIVSRDLFERFLDEILKFQMEYRASRRTVTKDEVKLYHEFLEYTVLGWMRPDKLPISFQVQELKTDWFEFFNSLSNGKSEVGNYKVSAGVFKDYKHLELYTISGIKQIRDSLLMEE